MRTLAANLLRILAFAAAGQALAATAPTPVYSVTKRYALGGAGGWDYLVADPKSGHLFISRSDRALVVNLADGSLAATIPGTDGIHGFALVHELGRGYTSNGRADNLTVFDLATLKPTGTIAVSGHNPDAILYDKASRHLFTFNGRSQDVSVIDPQTEKVVATIPVGGKPEFAVTDDHGRIFFNVEDTAELVQLDSRNAKLTARWKLNGCEEPTGLAFDEAHQRLFSVCQNGRMIVTDSASGKFVASVAIGSGADGAVYDAQLGLVFSSNGGDGTLTVVKQNDADHYAVAANVPTLPSARTLALDPESHLIYLVGAKFQPMPAPAQGQARPRAPVLEGSFEVIVVGSGADAGKS